MALVIATSVFQVKWGWETVPAPQTCGGTSACAGGIGLAGSLLARGDWVSLFL